MQTDLTGFAAATGGANRLLEALPTSAGWLLETVLTFTLIFVIFIATDNRRAQSTAHLPMLAPAAIGFAVFACHLAAVALDGCSINPARSFGPAVTSGESPCRRWDGPGAAASEPSSLWRDSAWTLAEWSASGSPAELRLPRQRLAGCADLEAWVQGIGPSTGCSGLAPCRAQSLLP